jgi:hypothetical protein
MMSVNRAINQCPVMAISYHAWIFDTPKLSNPFK